MCYIFTWLIKSEHRPKVHAHCTYLCVCVLVECPFDMCVLYNLYKVSIRIRHAWLRLYLCCDTGTRCPFVTCMAWQDSQTGSFRAGRLAGPSAGAQL